MSPSHSFHYQANKCTLKNSVTMEINIYFGNLKSLYICVCIHAMRSLWILGCWFVCKDFEIVLQNQHISISFSKSILKFAFVIIFENPTSVFSSFQISVTSTELILSFWLWCFSVGHSASSDNHGHLENKDCLWKNIYILFEKYSIYETDKMLSEILQECPYQLLKNQSKNRCPTPEQPAISPWRVFHQIPTPLP